MKFKYSKILSLCLLVTLLYGNKAAPGFLQGTQVAVPTSDGAFMLVPIESLEEGDLVLGRDPEKGVVPVVINRIKRKLIKYFVMISIGPDRYISSDEGQLYCEYEKENDAAWKAVSASKLKSKSILHALQLRKDKDAGRNTTYRVISTKRTSWWFSQPYAYFLEVDRTHNYYVSDYKDDWDYMNATMAFNIPGNPRARANDKETLDYFCNLSDSTGKSSEELLAERVIALDGRMPLLVHNAIPVYSLPAQCIFETAEFLGPEAASLVVGIGVMVSNVQEKAVEILSSLPQVDQDRERAIRAEYDHIVREEQKQLKAEYDSYSNTSIHGTGYDMTEIKGKGNGHSNQPTQWSRDMEKKSAEEQRDLKIKYSRTPSINMDSSDIGIIEINGEYCPKKNGVVRYKDKYYKTDSAEWEHNYWKKQNEQEDRKYGRKEYPFGINTTKHQDKIIRDQRIREKEEREARIKQYIEQSVSMNPSDVDRIAQSINDGSYRYNLELDNVYTPHEDVPVQVTDRIPRIDTGEFPVGGFDITITDGGDPENNDNDPNRRKPRKQRREEERQERRNQRRNEREKNNQAGDDQGEEDSESGMWETIEEKSKKLLEDKMDDMTTSTADHLGALVPTAGDVAVFVLPTMPDPLRTAVKDVVNDLVGESENINEYIEEQKLKKGQEWEEYLRKQKEMQRLQKEKEDLELMNEGLVDQATDRIRENIKGKKRGWFSNWFSSNDDRYYKGKDVRDIYQYGDDQEKYDYLKSKYSEKDYVWKNY